MSERYTRLFSLPQDLYCKGSPLLIAAGALLKDNQTGKVLAQLKFRSISPKVIQAVSVKITAFDTAGRPLGGETAYQYLDLSAERDAEFGQKIPVFLPDSGTRSFSAAVTEVVFSDKSLWTPGTGTWKPLGEPKELSSLFQDVELRKQYRIQCGDKCKYVPRKGKTLWYCACGALNHADEPNCHVCRQSLEKLLDALDLDTLSAERDTRLEQERIQREQEQQRQAKQAAERAEAERIAKAKRKKAIKIAIIIVVVVIGACAAGGFGYKAVQRNNDYKDAVALLEAGDYESAEAAFVELGDYKDSAKQAETAKNMRLEEIYIQACADFESGNYITAEKLFSKLGDYKDSANLCEEAQKESNPIYRFRKHIIEQGSFDENFDTVTHGECSAYFITDGQYTFIAPSSDEEMVYVQMRIEYTEGTLTDITYTTIVLTNNMKTSEYTAIYPISRGTVYLNDNNTNDTVYTIIGKLTLKGTINKSNYWDEDAVQIESSSFTDENGGSSDSLWEDGYYPADGFYHSLVSTLSYLEKGTETYFTENGLNLTLEDFGFQ